MKDIPIAKKDLPTPKRGAFPTPIAEIESATPYRPKSDREGDQPEQGAAAWPTSSDQPDNSIAPKSK
jgi:hypothetical protein